MPVYTLRDPTSGTILHISAPDPGTAQMGAQHWAQQNQGYVQARAQANKNLQANNAGWGDAGRAVRSAGQGASYGVVDDLAGGINAGLTGLQNFAAQHGIGKPAGYNMADAYKGTIDADRADEKSFEARAPIASTAAKIAGAVVAPGSLEGAGWIAKGASLPARMARGAAVGAGIGAANGAGSAAGGDIGQRAQGAFGGAVAGGATGAVVPVASAAIAPIASKVGSTIGGVANNVGRAMGMVPPQQTATSQLAAMLMKDGATGQSLQDGVANFPGASQPTIADLGGENTRALVRNAGTAGPARQALAQYRDQVAGNLQDNVLNLTGQLTPNDPRTTQQALADLLDTRQQNARTNYAEPYSQTINITPEVVSALRDPEGQAAVQRAIAGSRGLQDYDTVGDLQRLAAASKMSQLPGQGPVSPYYTLTTSAPPLTPTTGRALDAIQQAFGRTGRSLAEKEGSGDLAAGLFMRQGKINDALDSFDALGPARADYKNLSAQMEAVDHGGTGTTMPPDDYASTLATLLAKGSDDTAGNQIQGAAGIGYRQALANKLGNPTEGALGAINQIATSTNQGQNLATTFGPDAADAYRSGLSAEGDRMANANWMAPQLGSKTFSSGQDAAHFNPLHLAKAVLDYATNGPPLSDLERAAIVQGGLSTSPDDLAAALMQKSNPNLLSVLSPYAVPPSAQLLSGPQTPQQ